jgi:hypothetical protein
LFEIDVRTGEATLVGRINFEVGTRKPGYEGIGSLAFSPNGTLYATLTSAVPVHDRAAQLITIDTSTFDARIIGDVAPTSGLAIDLDGTAYAMTIRVNTVSPLAGGLAVLNVDASSLTDCFPNDDYDYTGYQTLAFNSAGKLFAGRERLASIDLHTGQYTPIGTRTNFDIRGMEFIVPEPRSALVASPLVALLVARRRK